MSNVFVGRFGAENSPSSFVVVVLTTRLSFVGSVIVTVAPGTTAPDPSRTVPLIDPVTSCAIATPERQSETAIKSRIELHVFLLVILFRPLSKS